MHRIAVRARVTHSASWLIFGALIFACFAQARAADDGFVLVRASEQIKDGVGCEDFEMLDHPLTNAEYKRFIDATSYPAPLHWQDGKIPAGKEDYPVIFVNRFDVAAYLNWRTEYEGRVYRLPTTYEFSFAQSAGAERKKYPWGEGEAPAWVNFDRDGSRRFDRWTEYLQPARSGEANALGLYGMVGNVWQMVDEVRDLAVTGNDRYRIDNMEGTQKNCMGGSWARSLTYLRLGKNEGISSGLCQPDLGFRPVRSPESVDWHNDIRRICAVPNGNGTVFVSWALLNSDRASTRFDLYRAENRRYVGVKVNDAPIADATCFVDKGLTPGTRYQYCVRALDAQGRPGRRSEWIGGDAGAKADPVVARYEPVDVVVGDLPSTASMSRAPIPVFGDLNGDGALDCVVRLPNGIVERSRDTGAWVELEAYNSFGRSLWRRRVCDHGHCYGNHNNVPFVVWDLYGDGRAEVVARLQIGENTFLAILDGMSGDILRTTPWIPVQTDHQRSSTRMQISIACLDGKTPSIVIQSGLYENEILAAYDVQLNQIWRFNSFAETSGSGAHRIVVRDVDGDGRQEVFDGSTCLKPDGTVRWSTYLEHPDTVQINDILPDRPGLEIFYTMENSIPAGAYLVDAATGKILWKNNQEDDPRWSHAHEGWAADIWDGSPGIECASSRGKGGKDDMVLFSAEGRILADPFIQGLRPVVWDASPTHKLLKDEGRAIGAFNGKEVVWSEGVHPNPFKDARLIMTADLWGDFRDELVLLTRNKNGLPTISIVTPTDPVKGRYISQMESRDYRLWLSRNGGGGYRAVPDDQLLAPKD